MKLSPKEPSFLFTMEEIAERSPLAASFLSKRTRQNDIIEAHGNPLVARFFNIDHNTYMEGALTAKVKELMGLVASACLRCDDCISYHVIQSYRLGASREEQDEALNVALVVGGSIVVPHLRKAYALLRELY